MFNLFRVYNSKSEKKKFNNIKFLKKMHNYDSKIHCHSLDSWEEKENLTYVYIKHKLKMSLNKNEFILVINVLLGCLNLRIQWM